MKSYMAIFFHEEMELHQSEWEEKTLPASNRRMLMAWWTVLAWQKLKTKVHLLRQAFVSTGFLLAADGSEDNLIKMSGLPEGHKYTYNNKASK